MSANVIGVQASDYLSSCRSHDGIGAADETEGVTWMTDDPHPRVPFGPIAEPFGGGVGGCIVQDHEFEVAEILTQDAGDSSIDERDAVVHRQDDRDLGSWHR